MDRAALIGTIRRLPIPSAPTLWASVVAAVLVADALLVAQNRETMSDWYGRHALPLTPVVSYLLLHLNGRPEALARFDPLHLAAEAIRKTTVRDDSFGSLL